MTQFMLLAKNGTTPPKYIHSNIESALAEAKRLNECLKSDIIILEIVGSVRTSTVQIVVDQQKINLRPDLDTEINSNSDELPF